MKNETWTAAEYREYIATGKKPRRFSDTVRTANRSTNVESDTFHAAEKANEGKTVGEGYSIHLYSQSNRDIDPDNICQKWAIDTLVSHGILPDDRSQVITGGIHKYHRKASPGRTIIEVRKVK